MDVISWVISIICGAIGGNILGSAWKEKTLGAVGNTIAGLVGGVAGTYLVHAIGLLNTLGGANLTVGQVIGTIVSSGIGGAILQGIVGAIKGAMGGKA